MALVLWLFLLECADLTALVVLFNVFLSIGDWGKERVAVK